MAAKFVPATTGVVKGNLPYFCQQFSAALKTSSPFVKIISITIFTCYVFSFNNSAIRVLSVTPGYIIPPNFWIWTTFTHCFFEMRFFFVFIDILTIGLIGKLIEPLWGTVEMITFFALVNISVAFTSVIFYIILYTITSDTKYLFDVHIHGLAGYWAAVSVAVTQVMPEHVLFSTPLGKIRNRNVPLNILLLGILLSLLNVLHKTFIVMYISGLYTSWIYLRFFQTHSNGTKGDMADSFRFSGFFPNVLQPPMSVLGNGVYSCLVSLRICKKTVTQYNLAASPSITVNLPGTDPQDAERRRQIALKALTERLGRSEQPTTWPSLLDNEESSSTTEEKAESKDSTLIDMDPSPVPSSSPTTSQHSAT